MSEAEQEDGDPAAAFAALRDAVEGLRAEVRVTRQEVAALPEAWAENRPPDYAPNFGWQKKALTVILEHLQMIEKHPALEITPEQYAARIENVGLSATRAAERTYKAASIEAEQATQRERQQLASLIGTIRDKREQRFWLILMGVMVFFCTFAVSPVIWRWLPFGLSSWSAAQIMNDDRWDAGWDLLQAANPGSEQQAAFGFELAKVNQKDLSNCMDAADGTNKDQHCVITVPVVGMAQ